MYCTVSKTICGKFAVIFYDKDDHGYTRNNRESEYFDDKTEALNHICELMIYENIIFFESEN